MHTETAPAAVETVAPAPVATEAPAAQAPAAEPAWKTQLKAHVAAKQAAAVIKPTVVREIDLNAPPTPKAAPAAVVVEPEKPAEVTPPAKQPEDEMAARLLEISQRTLAISKREKAIAEREKAAAEKYKPDLDLAGKLRAAQSTGKRLDILKAAGISEEEIRGSWVIDLLSELQETENSGPPLTEAQAAALWEKKQREKAEAVAKARQEEAARTMSAQQEKYFEGVAEAFKDRSRFSRVAAIRPTYAELDAELTGHFRATGIALQPAELLERFERRYESAGVTVATATTRTAPATASAKPAPKPAPKVVSREMLSDARGEIREISTHETYQQKTERLKAEMVKRFPKRSAAVR